MRTFNDAIVALIEEARLAALEGRMGKANALRASAALLESKVAA